MIRNAAVSGGLNSGDEKDGYAGAGIQTDNERETEDGEGGECNRLKRSACVVLFGLQRDLPVRFLTLVLVAGVLGCK